MNTENPEWFAMEVQEEAAQMGFAQCQRQDLRHAIESSLKNNPPLMAKIFYNLGLLALSLEEEMDRSSSSPAERVRDRYINKYYPLK
jgi:hypothetical protein